MKPGADPSLDLVRDAARERDPMADPRWDALARGALSSEEEAELRRKDPEAFEALRPLDAAAQARMVSGAVEALLPAPRTAKVIPLMRRRLPVAILAAAAAVVLAVWLGRPAGPLPAYELALAGGEREVRSGSSPEAPVPRLDAPQSRLEVRLRPAAEVQGDVAWRCALEGEGGRRPWSPAGAVKPGGTVVIAGTREELFAGVPSGLWTIACEVGRPGGPAQALKAQVQLGDAG
ncbi:MAG TPA: hypothetical protein VIG99_31020 [Myxococcaceae bacterium]|jgi:hypothetical protein